MLVLSACCAAQVLTVPNGGTGTNTLAVHGPLIGNGTGPITVGSRGIAGQCFISGGLSADPSFQACPGGGSMVYPGAGIANSTGSAWGTSYSNTNLIPANFISILNQSTTGNAATATALASTPTLCPAGQYALGILASGNATGCTTVSSSSGTVTSFSAGNLPPLFTTSVATPTITPALTFSLTSQAANTVFGNFSGSSAAPSFNAMSACGDSTHALSYTPGTGFTCQAITAGGGVTSVGLSAPANVFSISGSPVTSSGTLGLGFQQQNSSYFLAGPTTGATQIPFLVQTKTCYGNGVASSISCAFTNPVQAGSLLVAFVFSSNTAISDTLGQTYTLPAGLNWIYYLQNSLAGSNTVTVTLSAALAEPLVIAEFTGVLSSGAFDANAAQGNINAAPIAWSAVTNGNANDLIVATYTCSSSAITTFSPASPYFLGAYNNSGSVYSAGFMYRTTTATGAYTPTATTTPTNCAGFWHTEALSFKAGPATSSATPVFRPIQLTDLPPGIGGGGIASLNTDSTSAQTLAAGSGVTITDNGTGTHTFASAPIDPVANISGTYNATVADFQSCAMKYSAGGAVTVNLPINTSQPANGQCMVFVNYSSGGTITINRNGQNINGGTNPVIIAATTPSNLPIRPNSAWVWSDGTNYLVAKGSSSITFGDIVNGTNAQALVLGSGGTLGFSGSGAIVSPVVNTGVANNASGLKHIRVASCTTTAAVNGSCSGTITWTTTFADANYTVVCNAVNFVNGIVGVEINSVAAASLSYSMLNLAGGAAAASALIECIAMHD